MSNGPNLEAKHRATYVRLLDLPRHRWEPSRATRWPWFYVGRHRAESTYIDTLESQEQH